ncbi:AAA family ATPase [Lysobacter enzymogenes]|uniref:AAA family ATPase n=1 Tax=Lysobacter enzymogenes TaxID=69 RepID=UPI0022643959|nr:AAA family ATPase [Lysobacter enzymogenes]UZW58539.1 ATP-binding protein [Lysobacter enzymogenes]
MLQAVRDNCSRAPAMPPGQQRKELAKLREELAQAESQLSRAESLLNPAGHLRSQVQQKRESVRNHESFVLGVPIIEPDILPPPVIVDLTMADVSFQDATAVSGWADAQKQIGRQLDLNIAMQFGPGAVYALLANSVAATSSTSKMGEEERRDCLEKFERLNVLAEQILGAKFEIGRMEDGPLLFGHRLENARLLSSGQRMLLAVLYVLFFQEGADKDVIIIWDEPENHLHPDAAIKIIENLRGACPKAQIWMATHSVHILAHFQEHGIWFAREGRVTRGGKVAEKVLDSLLGDEFQLNRLAEFLAIPAQRALRLLLGSVFLSLGQFTHCPGIRKRPRYMSVSQVRNVVRLKS